MNTLNFIIGASLQPGDFTGFTFFIGSVSMLAATVFFLVQRGQVDKKFKDSMLVAALITGIAAVHYYYMRDQWAEGLGSPTELRYVDWILTVPLMVVEFALLTGVGMAKLFWLSVVMLVAGYFGESGVTGMLDAQSWGAISGIAYFIMAYEVGCLRVFSDGAPSGAVGDALANAKGKIPSAGRMLQWFVLVGWAIYPLGYMMGTDGWYSGAVAALGWNMDIVYNIGDAINKIGFGMAVWSAARD
jgi:bacteriorhodopsin